MSEELLTIKVTRRQLTLIRVACLQRLDRLKSTSCSAEDQDRLKDLNASYNETRAMMDTGGCLHIPTVEEDNLPSR